MDVTDPLSVFWCLLRDQLHQAGEGAAGGRGPEAGHACGGRHEAAGRRPARALRAHRPRRHNPRCAPQEQEKQSVSVSVAVAVNLQVRCSIITTFLLSFGILRAARAVCLSWTHWCHQCQQQVQLEVCALHRTSICCLLSHCLKRFVSC